MSRSWGVLLVAWTSLPGSAACGGETVVSGEKDAGVGDTAADAAPDVWVYDGPAPGCYNGVACCPIDDPMHICKPPTPFLYKCLAGQGLPGSCTDNGISVADEACCPALH